MVKYYTKRTDYDIIKVDIENDLVQSIDRNANVDYVYFIDEDGTIIVKDDDKVEKIEVNAGDVVVKFYSADENYKNKEYYVIRNEGIIDYFKRYRNHMEESRKNKCCNCCECNDRVKCENA